MKSFQKILPFLLVLVLLVCGTALADEVRTDGVKKMAIEDKPAKLVYMIGDEFDPAGGTLKITYSDKSTAIVPMTDSNVTFSGAKLTSEGKKSVTVEFGGKSARLSITVSGSGYTVTFDEGYEGGATTEAMVIGGAKVELPEVSREGYTLLGWYTDADFRQLYDASAPVNSNMTLVAGWLKNDAEPVHVTFDYNYYGDLLTAYTRVLAKGETVAQPAAPARTGYVFDRWQMNGADYDFTQPVNEDITLTAVWTKTAEGANTYVFEAEDTDLTGKEGVSNSGASVEKSMIVYDPKGTAMASNSRWVGFLYKPNLSLDFYFAADEAVSDAVLELSIATELPGNYVCDPDTYAIMLNGTPIDFKPFSLENDNTNLLNQSYSFNTVVVAEGVELQAGANTLQLYPINHTAINGTTYQAVGPLVDCVKITTSAVLIWDAVKGLPADNY